MDVDTCDLWTCPSWWQEIRHPEHVALVRSSHGGAVHGGQGAGGLGLLGSAAGVVATCGPYSIVANKSRLEFMVRVRFAGMDAVSERGMSFSFWLKERLDSPRFHKVVLYGRTDWVHHMRVAYLDDLDEEVQAGCVGRTRSVCQLG